LFALIAIVTTMALGAGVCNGHSKDGTRSELVKSVEDNTNVSVQVKSQVIDLLRDDNKSLLEPEIYQRLSRVQSNKDDEFLSQSLLFVLLFRNSDNPSKVIEIAEKVPEHYQPVIISFVWLDNHKFMHKEYSVIGFHFLDLLAGEAAEKPVDSKNAAYFKFRSQMAIDLIWETKPERAVPNLFAFLKEKVKSGDLRFAVVRRVAACYQCDAVEVLKWYFGEYCHKQSEFDVIAPYLQKCLTPDEATDLISKKMKQLEADAKPQ
jgi:hypothetical protein